MLDRVREAVFSSLRDLVEDARVLDLYAGTGSLGLEALSRGAREVTFVERDRAIVRVLEQNVATLGVEDRCRIVRADALSPGVRREADLVFLDPPYPLWQQAGRAKLLTAVLELASETLDPQGTLILHAPPRTDLDRDLGRVQGAAPRLEGPRTYGRSDIWYISPPEA